MPSDVDNPLPYATPNQAIGLLGGSFDPPHEGHKLISLEAIRRFNLDQLWWLVTPQNPLKTRNPTHANLRIKAAQELITHPRVHILNIESQINTTYTAQTIKILQKTRPELRFVWLMGADNLVNFHHWYDWRSIMERVPVGVLARPGMRMRALNSPAARIYKSRRIPHTASGCLAHGLAPRWCFVNIPMSDLSSTQLRQKARVRTN